jgi:signal transduction histidine kinase
MSDTHRDLTFKKTLEQVDIFVELQRSFERLLEQSRYQVLLLNNVRDAVVVWNLDGKITYANPAAQRLFGWSQEKWLTEPVETYLSIFSPRVRVPGGEGTGGLRVERYFNNQLDITTWVSSHVYALRDYSSDGKLIGYMDVCRDITERKQMEARVQAAQIQLIQATRLAAIGELASGIAHHVNNPLTTIIAEAQLLKRYLTLYLPQGHPDRESATTCSTAAAVEQGAALEQAGWRVQRSVQQLLDFSQPPTNTLEILDINHTITAALELVGDQIRALGVVLDIHLSENLPSLRGNTRQLIDLWVNLLMLARMASSDGQQHRIIMRSWSPESHSIAVEISDDGEPIDPEEMVTLFEPSFLKNLGRRGTGIELTLCQEIVRQHSGRISAESSGNGVTIFRVILPADTRYERV